MRPMSVFVGGLGDDVSKEDLEREFGKYGPLSKVWVAQNPPGFAFIEFESVEDANEAIDAMNGTTINNSRIRVEMSRNNNRGRRGGGGFRGRGGRDGGFRGRGGSSYSRREDSYGSGGGGGSYRMSGRDSGNSRSGGDEFGSRDQYSSNYGGAGGGNYKSSSYRSRSPVGNRNANNW